METKNFLLRVVLTVTSRRLLTAPKGEDDNGIGDLYEILGWMTNDEPYTHQLGRFMDECRPYLLRWFPELEVSKRDLKRLDKFIADESSSAVERWLAWIKETGVAIEMFYDVPRIPKDDHTVKDARVELKEMHGSDEGIIEIDISE